MNIIFLTILYFIALLMMFVINDKWVKDWAWWPGYAVCVLLAPISVPIVTIVYAAYAFYTKLIKPRINK